MRWLYTAAGLLLGPNIIVHSRPNTVQRVAAEDSTISQSIISSLPSRLGALGIGEPRVRLGHQVTPRVLIVSLVGEDAEYR